MSPCPRPAASCLHHGHVNVHDKARVHRPGRDDYPTPGPVRPLISSAYRRPPWLLRTGYSAACLGCLGQRPVVRLFFCACVLPVRPRLCLAPCAWCLRDAPPHCRISIAVQASPWCSELVQTAVSLQLCLSSPCSSGVAARHCLVRQHCLAILNGPLHQWERQLGGLWCAKGRSCRRLAPWSCSGQSQRGWRQKCESPAGPIFQPTAAGT